MYMFRRVCMCQRACVRFVLTHSVCSSWPPIEVIELLPPPAVQRGEYFVQAQAAFETACSAVEGGMEAGREHGQEPVLFLCTTVLARWTTVGVASMLNALTCWPFCRHVRLVFATFGEDDPGLRGIARDLEPCLAENMAHLFSVGTYALAPGAGQAGDAGAPAWWRARAGRTWSRARPVRASRGMQAS